VSDLRGTGLLLAVVAGGLGAWFGNLAITAGLALLVVHGGRLLARQAATTSTLER
jgi:hypothetical protein